MTDFRVEHSDRKRRFGWAVEVYTVTTAIRLLLLLKTPNSPTQKYVTSYHVIMNFEISCNQSCKIQLWACGICACEFYIKGYCATMGTKDLVTLENCPALKTVTRSDRLFVHVFIYTNNYGRPDSLVSIPLILGSAVDLWCPLRTLWGLPWLCRKFPKCWIAGRNCTWPWLCSAAMTITGDICCCACSGCWWPLGGCCTAQEYHPRSSLLKLSWSILRVSKQIDVRPPFFGYVENIRTYQSSEKSPTAPIEGTPKKTWVSINSSNTLGFCW